MERNLPNCAKAFNLALTLFIIRLPLSFLSPHFSFTLIGLAALILTVSVVGLTGYLAYQCGLHPALAILLPAGLLVPYIGTVILILILIQSRIFLQTHGYVVGLTKARENPDGVHPWPDIPFRRHAAWLTIFAGVPWGIFLLVRIINPEYNAKFFLPYDHWFGLAMLLAALVVTILIYPLSIQFQRLRAEPKSTGTIKVQMGMVLSLAFVFCLIASGILVLTPAAITMMQQMAAQ